CAGGRAWARSVLVASPRFGRRYHRRFTVARAPRRRRVRAFRVVRSHLLAAPETATAAWAAYPLHPLGSPSPSGGGLLLLLFVGFGAGVVDVVDEAPLL